MSDTSTNLPCASVLEFPALLLDVLGFTEDEFVSLGYQKPGGKFCPAVLEPAAAITAVAEASTAANLYFGINPVRGPARTNAGRGTEADVTRLAALPVDLDMKPGACHDLEAAHGIIDALSGIVGARPSALTYSGHGLHAYWPVDGGHITDTTTTRALLRRWGRLVATVAESHGAKADSVFDLARMMRAPGSYNNKKRASQ
jgi:hypothetical protein